jgi:hypothetical protein
VVIRATRCEEIVILAKLREVRRLFATLMGMMNLQTHQTGSVQLWKHIVHRATTKQIRVRPHGNTATVSN